MATESGILNMRVGVTFRHDGVVEIKRSKGIILMDREDFDQLKGSVRLAFRGGYLRPLIEYWNGGAKDAVCLYAVIMGRRKGMVVDHINGDRLDNRRCNLRFATRQQNAWNARKYRHSTSSFKGVRPSGKRWRAVIYEDNRQINLGHYETEIEAALAYDCAARERRGEFATLNFPRDGERGALS